MTSEEHNNTLAISIIKHDGNKDIYTECTIIYDKNDEKLVDVIDYEIYDKIKKSKQMDSLYYI